MATNFNKLYAMKKRYTATLKKYIPSIANKSGIYVYERYDNTENKHYAYIGQSVNVLERTLSHLIGYSQRIDISLKKRGIFKDGGWYIQVFYCDKEKLDEMERAYIKEYQDNGYELYNITNGGQGNGKSDINERQATKGYQDGLKQGYHNCQRYVQELFSKYLDYAIKEPRFTKKGEPIKIKEKKYAEFGEFIGKVVK